MMKIFLDDSTMVAVSTNLYCWDDDNNRDLLYRVVFYVSALGTPSDRETEPSSTVVVTRASEHRRGKKELFLFPALRGTY